MILYGENIYKNYGMKQLLKNVTIHVEDTDKIGIIGINGTGKSTFLRILSNTEDVDSGKVWHAPNLQIGFLKQNPAIDEEISVLEQVFLD
ncbi:MAG: ATP-binding cassette domain-containing protein, partial [Anaerotignaceae bacterium]